MTEKTEKWVRPIICGLIVIFLAWVFKKFWESGNMKTYMIDFLITFSPVIIGLFAFLIYWLIRDYIKLRKFSYRHDHAVENVKGLPDKIKVWDNEPADRVEAINKINEEIAKWRETIFKDISGWSEETIKKYRELGGSIEELKNVEKGNTDNAVKNDQSILNQVLELRRKLELLDKEIRPDCKIRLIPEAGE